MTRTRAPFAWFDDVRECWYVCTGTTKDQGPFETEDEAQDVVAELERAAAEDEDDRKVGDLVREGARRACRDCGHHGHQAGAMECPSPQDSDEVEGLAPWWGER